ncbi:MAG: DUF937 domain-containing protein [Xanthobacteraceae bacterium]|nr:DUF937 domain-containing protein [Xanthobacteraceae bacterium]
MTTNLVSFIMQFLTPDMVARIAAALGLSPKDAQTGISAAVPALLAGLTGAAERPGGAQSLFNAVKQQSGMLDNLGSLIGAGRQGSVVDAGSQLLTTLLGGQQQSALAGAVGKFAGLGQGAGSSLLAMLAPVALGAIGKQLGPGALDAGSLTNLLASQKGQIADAMPTGFGKLLAGTGVLDSLGGSFGSAANAAAAAANQATRAAANATGRAAEYASSGAYSLGQAGHRAAAAGPPNWLYWAIPLVLIAGGLWYLIGYTTRDEVAEQVTRPAPAVESAVVGGVDIGKQLGDSLNSVRTSLQGVTDAASATAAVPRLREASAQVDRVNSLLGQLSEGQRKTVAGLAASASPTLNQSFDKVLAIPGVGQELQPVIDTLRTKLAGLSGQPVTTGAGR